MRPLIAAVTLLSLSAAPKAADAKCAMMHLQPEVLTADVAVPAGGGGIVVGTTNVPYNEPELGDAVQKSWGFMTGRDVGQPVITVLAPGLAVYSVAKNMRTTGELTDGKTVVAKLTVTTDKVPLLPAPKVTAVTHRQQRDRRWSATTKVRVSEGVPAGAIAIVMYDSKRTARSWHAVTEGAFQVDAYEHGRCRVVPNGTVMSKLGDKVMVAWVDRYGRLSPTSKVVTIQAAP